MIPLGSHPVLDRGFVSVISASPDSKNIREIRSSIFRGVLKETLLEIPKVVMRIRCPYVVLHSLTASKLRTLTDNSTAKDQVYEPKVDEIRSGSFETDKEQSEFLCQTLNALMINQETLQKDGCNEFIASLSTPIAAYWEGIVYGDLIDWLKVVAAPHAPKMIKQYQEAIKTALSGEYLDLDEFLRKVKV